MMNNRFYRVVIFGLIFTALYILLTHILEIKQPGMYAISFYVLGIMYGILSCKANSQEIKEIHQKLEAALIPKEEPNLCPKCKGEKTVSSSRGVTLTCWVCKGSGVKEQE